VAAVIDEGYEGAEILVIHFEGPYLDMEYKGAQPPEAIAKVRGDELGRVFKDTGFAHAAEAGAAVAAPNGGALTEFERMCDDAVMAYLAKARMIPFGEQPVIAYLYAREAEATAIRIILTGRMAGIDGTTIRQRLSRAYC